MKRTKLFTKMVFAVVLILIVGGVGMAFLTGHGTSAGSVTENVSDTIAAGGVAPSNLQAGVSPPSTVILGAATETITSAVASTTTEFSTTTDGQASSSEGSQSSVTNGHSVEFLGSITLQVTDPSASLQQASGVAEALGGYVGSTTYSSSENNSATVTLLVPAANFEAALTQLQGLGVVENLQSSSNDVTVQYTDLNATLASLLTEQSSLLRLLNQSSSVNSTIQIESILQQTDAQIDQTESQILQIAQLVDYATITVNLETAAKTAPALPLELKLSATPRTGMSPLSVTFDAIVTGGVGPYVVNYNFGDGTSSEGQQLIHTFTQAGTYNVTVSATDQNGSVTLASVVIKVTSPPTTSGFQAFGATVVGLLSSVVEGIVEVAVVVLPIVFVGYLAVVPAYRRLSRNKPEGRPPPDEASKDK